MESDKRMVLDKISKEMIFDYYKYSVVLEPNIITASQNVIKYETKDSFIWLINPNDIELDIYSLEKLDNINNYVYEIEGIWACIIQNKLGNEFRAITSIQNELPWYYSNELKGIIANNIFLVAKLLKYIEINHRAISSFLAFDFCYFGETFLKNVEKSYGGDILYLSNNKVKIIGCDLQKWLGFDGSISNRNLILETFVNSVDKYLQDSYPQINLTGGSDSRAILAAALVSGRDFTLFTGTSSIVSKRDIHTAEVIAKIIDKKHYEIDASDVNLDSIDSAIEKVAIQTNAEFTPRNWIIHYKEYVHDSDKLRHISRLKGYRGEYFKGFYKGPSGSVDVYFNRHSYFINKKYRSIIYELYRERYLFYKNLSGINANELFYHRERDNFWVSCNIRTHINYSKIYTPFSDNRLLSLGYRFTGGIKECKLHESALNLLPPKLRNIPTSASQLTIYYHQLQKKFQKNKSHSIFLTADYLQENIDYDLLSEVVQRKIIESLIDQYRLKGLNSNIVHKMFAISYFFNLIK